MSDSPSRATNTDLVKLLNKTTRLIGTWGQSRQRNEQYQGLLDEPFYISPLNTVRHLVKIHSRCDHLPKTDAFTQPIQELNDELKRSIVRLHKIDKGGEKAEKRSPVLKRDIFEDIDRRVKMRIKNLTSCLRIVEMSDMRRDFEKQQATIKDMSDGIDKLVATCDELIRENDKCKVRCLAAGQEKRRIEHGLQELRAEPRAEKDGTEQGSAAMTEGGFAEQNGNEASALTMDQWTDTYGKTFEDAFERRVRLQSGNQGEGRVQNEVPNASAESSSGRRIIQIAGPTARQEASTGQTQPPLLGQTSPNQEAWDNATSRAQSRKKRNKKKKSKRKKKKQGTTDLSEID